MKKTLIIAAAALTIGSAQAYTSAGSIRDSLGTVYGDLGGNFGGSTAGGSYAETLRLIDNIGPSHTPIVVTTDANGHVVYTGGEATGNATVQDVIDQVQVFTTDLNANLFQETTGLATIKLSEIVAAASTANAVLLSDASTADKDAALATFTGVFATESIKFNNAVDALGNISDGIGSVTTEAGFDGYKLGGLNPQIVEANGRFENSYASYTDYVADNPSSVYDTLRGTWAVNNQTIEIVGAMYQIVNDPQFRNFNTLEEAITAANEL